jgi:hypothetical protein
MKLPRSLRLLIAYALGDDDRRVPRVPEEFPPAIVAVVAQNLDLLTDYQDAEFARLYLYRISRFSNRRDIDEHMLDEFVRLLGVRMAYEDLIRHAQQVLQRRLTSSAADGRNQGIVKPTLGELVAMLPASIAEPVFPYLDRFGWTRTIIPIALTGRTWQGRLAARALASLRRMRPRSVRYLRENALVERWLHMIDRATAKQPQAVWEVIETATLLHGHGGVYARAVANWKLIIDRIAKPTFDGNLQLPDLAEQLAQLRALAATDPKGNQVGEEIATIRAGVPHAA